MSDCHVCTDGNAGMFGDWLADDVGPEWDDTDYNAGGMAPGSAVPDSESTNELGR
jgi:hypothetical protein